MQRNTIQPRPDWFTKVTKLGFDFVTTNGIPYWTENAYYKFTAAEIDTIRQAANKLHKLHLLAVEKIIRERQFPLMGIDPEVGKLITESWDRSDPALHGRFDLLYDGSDAPKLLEYNADAPTSLFEASVIQANWRDEVMRTSDQFNNIHKSLVQRWQAVLIGRRNKLLHVTTATPQPEDETTVQYMGQIAKEAGFEVKFIPLQEIGWDENAHVFVDLDNIPMQMIFKLYPWEWIMRESFGANVKPSGAIWFEPMWKMLLSNKSITALLWEMFPEHENLLPTFKDRSRFGSEAFVQKPITGRQGVGISIIQAGKVLAETDGAEDATYVYQKYQEAPQFDGNRANLGVWMVGSECAGMGMREDNGLIVGGASRFVPHVFT